MKENKIKYCPECGEINNIDSFYCSSCGYNFIENKQKKSKNKKKISIIIAIFAFVVSYFYSQTISNKYKFYENCLNVTQDMLNGAAEAEKTCNELVDVWHNSIWKVDDQETNEYTLDDYGYFYQDFNDALNCYESSSKYNTHIKKLKENYFTVVNLMNELRNSKIPSEYNRLYEDIEDLYELYVSFWNLPIKIYGSYNTFSEDFSNYDNNFMNKYQKVISYFD